VLLKQRRWAWARLTAVAAVASIVIGWGVAQYPDLLVDQITIDQAAGARATLIGLIIVFAAAAVTAVPAMVWLFVLVNQDEWQRDDAH
jgi:cytochrome bd ubiquinol oxidase subunit II